MERHKPCASTLPAMQLTTGSLNTMLSVAAYSLVQNLKRFLASVITGLAVVFATPALAQGEVDIDYKDGLYTVSIEQAQLSEVVNRLSEITDIPMNIAEDQDTTVSLNLSDYTLESLIEELSSSSMIVRRSIDGQDVISEVVFMVGSEGSDVPAAALPSGEPNEGIIAGGDGTGVFAEPQQTEDQSAVQTTEQPAQQDNGAQVEQTQATQ